MPGKRSPFGSPVEPISPPPKPACLKRAWVEAPGTAPGSERLIPMPIYRHSRPRGRRHTYKGREAGREGAPGLGRDYEQAKSVIKAESKSSQAGPNWAKPGPNFCIGKSLDLLGFPCPKRAFSRRCADPLGKKSFLARFLHQRRLDHGIPALLCDRVIHWDRRLTWVSIFRKRLLRNSSLLPERVRAGSRWPSSSPRLTYG
jgi:hypothetical protein